jgi:hypothetical protein
MTGVLTVISLVLVLAIVLIVAYHLIGIYLALKRGGDHLEKLAGGLVKIQNDTADLNAKVDTINGGLSSLVAPLLGANDNLAAIVKVATSG